MRLHLLFPTLPPALDGIGDYTAQMATALAASCDVTVLTGTATADPIPGVAVRRAMPGHLPGAVRALPEAIAQDPPDWLVVQYNPFSYGHLGFNPYLPGVLRAIKKRCPGTRIAVMAHEAFVPVTTWKFAVMTLWQRWLFWEMGRLADVLLLSIEPWAERFRAWFPRTPVHHLPVGSNMPVVPVDRAEARAAFGLDPATFVVGVFGTLHRSRQLTTIGHAARALHTARSDVRLLYVGPSREAFEAALPDIATLATGPLAPEAVSKALQSMDLYLAPFLYGVSSRRGSFMAGLQHGLPTLSTVGPQTDPVIANQNGSAFVLTEYTDAEAFTRQAIELSGDAARRATLGTAAARFFERTFAWDVLAEQLLNTLTTKAYHPV